jgi:hypothetical protein
VSFTGGGKSHDWPARLAQSWSHVSLQQKGSVAQITEQHCGSSQPAPGWGSKQLPASGEHEVAQPSSANSASSV